MPAPTQRRPAGIYVHLPFCVKKCPYCDFYSETDLRLKAAFLRALHHEIARVYPGDSPYDTVYLGGGTPSLFPPGEIGGILQAVRAAFPVQPDAEITLEINPGTVDRRRLDGYRNAGVNRISIGVQSFQDRHLEALGRLHSGKDADKAIRFARQAGFQNVGIDLIFGIPDQTRRSWLQDLETALSHEPEHLSCYQLTVEPGTPLARDCREGRRTPFPEPVAVRLMQAGWRYLTSGGYLHYEISNFARSPGTISRHNFKYWSFAPYMGLGPSAHSFEPPERRWNHRNTARYIDAIGRGIPPTAGSERLGREEQMTEAVYLGLRTQAGIDVRTFEEAFGVRFRQRYHRALETLRSEGLLEVTDSRCALTEKGFLFHETVALRLLDE